MEFKTMEECMNKWKYRELTTTMNVKVLVFIPADHPHLAYYYPNFAFCISSAKDTFGIIIDNHKDLGKTIADGKTISIRPPTWNNYKDTSEIIVPRSIIFNDKRKRGLYCATKTVFYTSLK